jgi:hypothetical protein
MVMQRYMQTIFIEKVRMLFISYEASSSFYFLVADIISASRQFVRNLW